MSTLKHRKKFFLAGATLFLLGLISFNAVSQYTPIRFNHLNTSDGLSHNRITSIYQDELGYMWFGTLAGLNRYNGYEFEVIKHNPSFNASIAENSIQWIGEGPFNYLWIKTSGGLSAYDIYKEQLVDVSSFVDSLVIYPEDIVEMVRDANGTTYIAGLDAGVRVVNKEGNISTLNIYNEGTVTDVHLDELGNLLIIYKTGLLVNYDINNEKVNYQLQLDGINNQGYQLSLFEDSQKGLWVWSESVSIGLLYYSDVSSAPKKFGEKVIGSEVVTDLIENVNGQVIVATDHGGITIINKGSWEYNNYEFDPADPKSLSHNCAISLYKSRDGIIWIGTNKAGVNYFNPGGNLFNYIRYEGENAVLQNDINAIIEDRYNNLWLGTDGGGLLHLNIETGDFNSFRYNPEDAESMYSNIIVSMLRDSTGIWVGTYHGGLLYFNGTKFIPKFNTSGDPDALSDDSIWEIFKDSKGNLWVGTLKGGVDVFDKSHKKIKHFSYSNGRLNSNYVTSIAEDKMGRIWMGTGYGIEVYDPEKDEIQHYLHNPDNPGSIINNNIVDIFICEEGEIWIGSYGGVSKYNSATDRFMHFTESEGLISNFIVAIVEDNEGNIWVSSNKGISKISFEDSQYQINNYDEADGLQGDSFNPNAVLKTYDGNLVFAGINGLNIFDPTKISNIEKPQKIVFTDFFIDNKKVISGEEVNGRKLLAQGLVKTDRITLKPDENSFTFEFAAISYFHPEKTLYRYKLDGFDPDWINVNSDQRRVNYTNLDPGSYTLLVQASNRQGNWQDDELRMEVHIATPFWQTPLAFFLYALLVVSLFLLIRRVIIDRERLTAQIRHDKIEAERQRQLDMMKIRFFTNVSHEFRTPLSLILTPVERLLKLDGEHHQNDYLLIRRNARRLLSLVNQLLDFRKIEVGQLSLHRSGGDFIAFLQDVIDSFADLSREKNIRLELSTGIKEYITTFDKDKIEKVMFNLLSNAFKFTHPGGRISVEIIDLGFFREGNQLQVKVTDNGIGIPPDKIDNIFTRFFQIEAPASMMNHGSGIGLSISKEFVELHGGTISVESNVNIGSCFSYILPLNKITSVEEIAKVESSSSLKNTIPQQLDINKATILLAEDNADFRFYLKDNLRQYYNILEAGNGKEAWKLAIDKNPDLVVSDIMMPQINGLELTRKIKKDPRTAHIPVILLTAHSSDDSRIEGLEAGAIEFLSKPFNFEILISSIRSSLHLTEQIRKADHKIEVSPSEIEITSLDEKFINKALKLVEENIENADYSVLELSKELCVSRGQLYKKLLSLTGKTPIEFIREIRLKRAIMLLQKSQLTVAEVAYKVGFNNPRYFSKYFKEAYQMLPSQFVKSEKDENIHVEQ